MIMLQCAVRVLPVLLIKGRVEFRVESIKPGVCAYGFYNPLFVSCSTLQE